MIESHECGAMVIESRRIGSFTVVKDFKITKMSSMANDRKLKIVV